MTRRLRRPSPALLIALLALFVSLGGTGYAALKVSGKNVKDSSLTGKDFKNSSITGSDVKNRALTAGDFKAGQLPAGPQGPQGAPGPTGASLPPLPPPTAVRPHRPGVETCPPDVNGEFCNNIASGTNRPWTNVEGFAPVAFSKDRSGWVHLQGTAFKTVSGDGDVFILPPGFRPSVKHVFPVYALEFGQKRANTYLEVQPDGRVAIPSNQTTGYEISLDGISFRP